MVFPKDKLAAVGPRAEPFLLDVLDDPRYRVEFEYSFYDSPYEVVVDLLAALGSARLVEHLSPLLASAESDERKFAALHIAHAGTSGAAGPTLRALGDTDSFVRSYAIIGINRAVQSGRAAPGFLRRMFDALTPIAAGEATLGDGDAAECLVNIDAARALPLLQTDRFLGIDNPDLLGVLEVLSEHEIRVASDRIWPIVERAKSTQTEYPWSYIYGETLIMLAAQHDDRVIAEINRALDSESDTVRADAAEALLRVYRLPTPSALAYDVYLRGYANATEPENFVQAIMRLDAEINNGGFSQYFFNSSGDRWPIALAAAQAMGATHLAAQLERAVDLFGRLGPSLDREERIDAYGALSESQDAVLDELSSAHYDDLDHLSVLVARYMIRHQDSITRELSE